MTKKVRHIIRFEKEDEIFDGIDGDVLTEAIEKELPDEVEVGKCYCEYPKPYGHRPYVSVVTIEQKFMIDKPQERSQAIMDGVESGVLNIVDGVVDEKQSEGWM